MPGLEGTIAVVGVLGAIIVAVLAYKEQASRKRRVLSVVAGVCGVIGVAAAAEGKMRSDALADARLKAERDWLRLTESPVASMQFEVLSADGFMALETLLEALASIRFSSAGLNLFGTALVPTDNVSLSLLATLDNVLTNGRIGAATARLQTKRGSREVEQIVGSECYASTWLTESGIADARMKEYSGSLAAACSAMLELPLREPALMRSLLDTSTYRLIVTLPDSAPCFGPCESLLVSIRAVLPQDSTGFVQMIELSPQVLIGQPTRSNGREHEYSISGATLRDLQKSRFVEALGFRARGFMTQLGPTGMGYREVTKRTHVLRPVGTVWTTARTAKQENLVDGVPSTDRESVEAIAGSPWCGFGDHQVCWYRYVVVPRR